jgi:hypothetical protein
MFCIVFAWLVICSRVEGESAMVVRVGLHKAERQILVFTDVRKKILSTSARIVTMRRTLSM